MEAFAYFPSVVYRDEKPEWVHSTLQAVYPFLNDAQNNENDLCQTCNLANDASFAPIARYIQNCAVDILRDQGYFVDKYEFFVSMWGQKINKNEGTMPHVHKNSQLSGWYFLEIPEGGAYPIYHDTRSTKAMVELDYALGKEITNATKYIHFNNVHPGTILFANSWLTHQLAASNSDTPTIAVHFVVTHQEKYGI